MNKILYATWGGLYILCVGLGLLESATGVMKAALVVISLVFFVPGGLLLYRAHSAGDRKGILRIRWICVASLGLTTLALMVLIVCAAFLSETGVNVAYDVLALVSAPMLCGQYRIMSLFLWGCLLSATFFKSR